MANDATLKVTLYLYGQEISPTGISTLLNAQADKSWEKGQIIGNFKSAQPVVAKTGVWAIGSSVSSNKVEDHLDAIISRVTRSHQGSLLQLPGVDYAKIDIFVLIAAKDEFECSISSDRSSTIGQLGLRLDFTFGCMMPGE